MAKSHGVYLSNGEAMCPETELNELLRVSFLPIGNA